MPRATTEKLLGYSFSEKELKTLHRNGAFLEWSAKIKTLEQFEQLCIFAFDLLEQEKGFNLSALAEV